MADNKYKLGDEVLLSGFIPALICAVANHLDGLEEYFVLESHSRQWYTKSQLDFVTRKIGKDG